MPNIIVRSRARDDMAGIFARIAPHNLEAALRVNDAIEHAIAFLGEHPGAGPSCESTRPGTEDFRFWPLKKYTDYLVIYRPTTDGIDVVRVVHGALDMHRVLRRL